MPTMLVNNINLYYETIGQGPPILFIHGLGSSSRDWEGQSSYFGQHYQVITVDLRGHGQSAKPAGPYSIALFAQDIAALMTTLEIDPAHIVGISLGGMVAFELTISRPDLVASLVIVNSAPWLPMHTLRERLRVILHFALRWFIVRGLGMRKMAEMLSTQLFPKSEHASLRQTFITRWSQNDRHAYLNALKAMWGWSVVEHLPGIRCPTLVLAADHDYTSIAFKQQYTAHLPAAELVVISDSRHFISLEQPEQFNAALLHFLRALTN